MTPGQFLRLVWPDRGFYCIAHPFVPEGSTKQTYVHKVFATVAEAVTHCAEMEHRADTFFGCLSLTQPRIEDPVLVNAWNGKPKVYYRIAENIQAARCVFWDLDVGTEPNKYPTQRDLLIALLDFLKKSQLPLPTLVSSGGGVHVYWPFVETLSVDEWRPIAWNLRQLGDALGMKVDPTRTTDVASVLRVPGTKNWKDRQNPRAVRILEEGAGATAVATFRQLLADALIRAGVVATPPPTPGTRAAPAADTHGLGEQVINGFGPKLTLAELAAACPQVQEVLRCHGEPSHPYFGKLDNNAWYHGVIGLIRHAEDGDNWCRKLTALHPRSVSNVDDKLQQSQDYKPTKCESMRQRMPWRDAPCQSCRFLHDPSVPNPLVAARKATIAAPPVVQLITPGAGIQQVLVPNPPKPYERLKTGGVVINRKDKDGNDIVTMIYPNDLYPLKRLVNQDDRTEQQVWRVTLPRTGSRDFTIDADVLYDSRKFCVAIANNGVYPNKADISALQDYMVAYISQLQKDLDGENQHSHLGWADDYRKFVLPDKTLLEDGTCQTTSLTTAAERASQFVQKRGTLQGQVQLMAFYNHPNYIPNQLVILGSLASILFYATGQHGIVVNCSGASGASKSTTLYTAGGLWGDPILWPINGTNRGATANARAQRVATNANLPTCVDEITHMPVKEIQDLVMNVTQPGHRLRLQTDGSERKNTDSYKSAIMIATANSSLHNALSQDNAAGTAGSMRVFEMQFFAQAVHAKAEADEFLRQLRQHYGHIGEQIVQYVIRNRVDCERRVQQRVREIDAEANIQSGERYWSAYVATCLVIGEIALSLGLLPYDVAPIRKWAVEQQIPRMRGVVKEEYRDSLAILTDYIAEKHSNILVVGKAPSIGLNTAGAHVAGQSAYPVNRTTGALLGHYDVTSGVLYLLKQGFRDYCNRIGATSTRIIDELSAPRASGSSPPARIITNKNARKVLGAGTDQATVQLWCVSIDMRHPEMSGVTQLTPVAAGTPSSAPAGQLKAVP